MNKLNAVYAEEVWPSVEARMQAALSSIQTANGVALHTSFGIHQNQGDSPVKSMYAPNEARDVVPQQVPSGGLVRVREVDRTPHL